MQLPSLFLTIFAPVSPPPPLDLTLAYKVTVPLVCAFALATRLLMKSKNANCDAFGPNSYTKREARYEPKIARR